MPDYPAMASDYTYLAQQLNARGLVYVHLVDHSPMGAPEVPQSTAATIRREFKGCLILSGGYDAERAESDLATQKCDLIAVGRPFLANPDLVARWKTMLPSTHRIFPLSTRRVSKAIPITRHSHDSAPRSRGQAETRKQPR